MNRLLALFSNAPFGKIFFPDPLTIHHFLLKTTIQFGRKSLLTQFSQHLITILKISNFLRKSSIFNIRTQYLNESLLKKFSLSLRRFLQQTFGRFVNVSSQMWWHFLAQSSQQNRVNICTFTFHNRRVDSTLLINFLNHHFYLKS